MYGFVCFYFAIFSSVFFFFLVVSHFSHGAALALVAAAALLSRSHFYTQLWKLGNPLRTRTDNALASHFSCILAFRYRVSSYVILLIWEGFRDLSNAVAEPGLEMFCYMGDYGFRGFFNGFLLFSASLIQKLDVSLVSLDNFLSSCDVKSIALCASFSLFTVSKLTSSWGMVFTTFHKALVNVHLLWDCS